MNPIGVGPTLKGRHCCVIGNVLHHRTIIPPPLAQAPPMRKHRGGCLGLSRVTKEALASGRGLHSFCIFLFSSLKWGTSLHREWLKDMSPPPLLTACARFPIPAPLIIPPPTTGFRLAVGAAGVIPTAPAGKPPAETVPLRPGGPYQWTVDIIPLSHNVIP